MKIIASWVMFRSCKHPTFDHFLGPSLDLVGKIKLIISHLLASCASLPDTTDTLNGVLCCFILFLFSFWTQCSLSMVLGRHRGF